ncbi:hypothetical protein ABEF79_01010 [Acinetobacter sp. ANC 7454]|uniref:hypothetical protein n=1 Tax=Acinetobacter thermotolerans TaxID=3151487 RepID=UPI00325BFED6
MNKSPSTQNRNKEKESAEPSVAPTPVAEQHPATTYVESVRITPERLYNVLLKNYVRQWGDQ